jgi:hypothetical protein
MAQYLCILRGGDDKIASMTQAGRDSHMQDWFTWVTKLVEQGAYKDGNPLDANHKMMKKKGSEIIFDGPYTESKEIVGGFMIIEAENLEEACELSKGCPIFDVDGTLEIAQVIPANE